jgi:group I intron endonuclease
MSTGFVYKWINTRSGKWYIGSHKGSVDDGYVGSGVIFRKAYKKHKDYFIREVIYIGPDFREIEDLILKTLDAESDRNSYNVSNYAIGGTRHFHTSKKAKERMAAAGRSQKGKVVSQEAREKIRQKLLGTKASDETKKKLSEMRKGEGNSFFGKQHTEETRRKISEKKKGKKMSKSSVERRAKKMMKRIYFPELDMYFESIIAASKHFGLHQSTISNMLNGYIRNRFGLRFHVNDQNTTT